VKVFLSHASESKPLVRRIAAQLPAHVDVWLDQDELEPGRFPQVIERAIREGSDFVAVFVCREALASPWVKREVDLARARQADLQRAFVIPVLLDDVEGRLHELGFDPAEWLYIDARDRSDEGLARSGAALAAELFKLASRLVESLRSVNRRALTDAFAAELAEYEQVAFRWIGSMTNRIDAMVAMQPAVDHVRECLDAYNAVSDRFIPRLALHRDRLNNAWREQRVICKHLVALIDMIEDGVYRGAMFNLNQVLGLLHEAMVVDAQGRSDAARLAAHEARKTELLGKAQASLERMTQDASELFADMNVELG
jgi:hypothetical protein